MGIDAEYRQLVIEACVGLTTTDAPHLPRETGNVMLFSMIRDRTSATQMKGIPCRFRQQDRS
jgi:hypothetical protein